MTLHDNGKYIFCKARNIILHFWEVSQPTNQPGVISIIKERERESSNFASIPAGVA